MSKITIEIDLDGDSQDPLSQATTEIVADADVEQYVVAAGLMALEAHITGDLRETYEQAYPMIGEVLLDRLIGPVARLSLVHEAMHSPYEHGTDLLPD